MIPRRVLPPNLPPNLPHLVRTSLIRDRLQHAISLYQRLAPHALPEAGLQVPGHALEPTPQVHTQPLPTCGLSVSTRSELAYVVALPRVSQQQKLLGEALEDGSPLASYSALSAGCHLAGSQAAGDTSPRGLLLLLQLALHPRSLPAVRRMGRPLQSIPALRPRPSATRPPHPDHPSLSSTPLSSHATRASTPRRHLLRRQLRLSAAFAHATRDADAWLRCVSPSSACYFAALLQASHGRLHAYTDIAVALQTPRDATTDPVAAAEVDPGSSSLPLAESKSAPLPQTVPVRPVAASSDGLSALSVCAVQQLPQLLRSDSTHSRCVVHFLCTGIGAVGRQPGAAQMLIAAIEELDLQGAPAEQWTASQRACHRMVSELMEDLGLSSGSPPHSVLHTAVVVPVVGEGEQKTASANGGSASVVAELAKACRIRGISVRRRPAALLPKQLITIVEERGFSSLPPNAAADTGRPAGSAAWLLKKLPFAAVWGACFDSSTGLKRALLHNSLAEGEVQEVGRSAAPPPIS